MSSLSLSSQSFHKVPSSLSTPAISAAARANQLVSAALRRDVDAMHELVEHGGVDINAVNAHGFTALHGACVAGYTDVVDFILLHVDVHINMVNESGSTALMQACTNGHDRVVQLLMHQPELKINRRHPRTGWTALHYASYHGHVHVVKRLLHHPKINIATSSKQQQQQTALDLALQQGHTQVAQILRKGPRGASHRASHRHKHHHHHHHHASSSIHDDDNNGEQHDDDDDHHANDPSTLDLAFRPRKVPTRSMLSVEDEHTALQRTHQALTARVEQLEDTMQHVRRQRSGVGKPTSTSSSSPPDPVGCMPDLFLG